ncbi:DUF3159 domain-containing protein [Saccharomonospora cyanea]|uniref:High-affinity Fe2+/Pb2+ permease n=1 Tax=Saccharomonospora cyanea NA-134 TaxID=882082 RepID=H5XMW7_9PSEU|nr:DUF3159 domain-containing protein [Saccharomonospora cyanea]EHR62092.1 high-affinity Fe2+/Pb2+ permease [Saccharomonospora cyanea NA-134]
MTEHSERSRTDGDTDQDTASEEDDRRTGESPGSDSREPQPTLLEQMGGVSGLLYSSLPVVVFVLANALFGLTVAIWSAVGSAVAIAVVRLVRKEPLQPAISGLFAVGIAAFLAYRTGSAKGFFLFGIWTSLVYFAVLAGSVVVRWPLAGVVWNLLNGSGMAWRKDRTSRLGYDIATLALAAVFAARFVVQRWLYDEDLTGWLAFAKIAMGYPLYGLALLVVVWAVRRSDRRLAELAAAAEPAETDEEIEARLRVKYGQPPPTQA